MRIPILSHLMDRQAARQIAEHGFWFVDIPRTSSSSLRAELGKTFGMAYGKRNILERDHRGWQMLPDHQPATKMRGLLGAEAWSRLFTFTIVRNPWDRLLSLYFYRKQRDTLPESLDFREYVLRLAVEEERRPSGLNAYPGFHLGAADFLTDDSGRLLVDFVGRYETREDDLRRIAAEIGCASLGAVHAQAAKPTERHYSQWYDDEMRDVIAELYARDVELFGYTFEDRRARA